MAGRAGEGTCLRTHPRLCHDHMRTVWPEVQSAREDPWTHAWEKHGSCSGLSAEGYFSAALAAEEAMLAMESWDEIMFDDGLASIFDRSFTLRALEAAFGGAFSAALQCETQPSTGKIYLTSVQQCIKAVGKGFPEPTTCPRWLSDEPTSCHPFRGIRGAEIWL